MVSEAERLALCTSVPTLIDMIAVNTRFKSFLIASEILNCEILDDLVEKYKDKPKDLVFRLLQLMKKRGNKDKIFWTLANVLKECGQQKAADLLQSEFTKHSQQEQSTKTPECSEQLPGKSTKQTVDGSTKDVNRDPTQEGRKASTRGDRQPSPRGLKGQSTPTGAPAKALSNIHRFTEQKHASLARLGLGASRMSRRDAEDLREFLKKTLPERIGPHDGDLVLSASYFRLLQNIRYFDTQVHPGEIETFDAGAKEIDENDLAFVSPDCYLKLSQRFGGKPTLCYSSDVRHPVLKASMTHEVKHCYVMLYLHPGRLFIMKGFVSVQSTLREIAARFVTWTTFTVRSKIGSQDQTLQPTMTASEWYKRSSTASLHIFLKDLPGTGSAIEEQRKHLLQLLRKSEREDFCGVVVRNQYKTNLTRYLVNETSTQPGHLQALNPSNAYNEGNVSFIPPECSIMVANLFGGKPELQLRKHGGCAALFDTQDGFRYFGVILYTTDGTLRKSHFHEIGSYYLSVSATLEEAVASAVGWFPRRAWSHMTLQDLDLKMKFEDAVHVIKTPGIVVLRRD